MNCEKRYFLHPLSKILKIRLYHLYAFKAFVVFYGDERILLVKIDNLVIIYRVD